MRKETEKKYRKICELRKAGKSRREIKEEIHCSEGTINIAIRLFGEKTKRDSFENHQTEIVEMWQAEPVEEPEVSPRQYENNVRRAKPVVIRGKRYLDVSAWHM